MAVLQQSNERPGTAIIVRMAQIISILAILMSIYQLYISLTLTISIMQQRAIHLGFGLVLTFLVTSFKKGWEGTAREWVVKAVLILLSLAGTGYIVQQYSTLVERFGFPTNLDIIFGSMIVLVSLEASRRMAGRGFAVIAILAIIYALAGPYLPGPLEHAGVQLPRFLSFMYLTTEGIYGSILGISATFVFMFILFGAFLNASGAGEFYIRFAVALLGKVKGGPAYVAVLASAFFGMISGSGVANAATTGVFTIPLMKRVGFKPYFAGAVEALSSTGGQIMPPIMGAAAFIMVDFLGVSYLQIIKAALIPALLYFIAIFFMLYFETKKLNLKPVEESEIPSLKPLLKANFHHFLPPLMLVVLLAVFKYTPLYSAVISIAFIVIASWFRKESRMGVKKILKALEDGARGALVIVAVCAVAGIIVGVINLTGVGLELSAMLINFAGGSLILLLILTMLSSIVLGMGLPTTACYIILAVLVAPALVDMGILPLAAHLFVLYFGVLALVTPPIAGCVYITAGIADAEPMRTGLEAVKLGLAGFIVPYMFVNNPILLMMGPPHLVLLFFITAVIGTMALAAGAQGYLLFKISWVTRVLLIASALLLIHPNLMTDIWGIVFLAIVLVQQFMKKRRGFKAGAGEVPIR